MPGRYCWSIYRRQAFQHIPSGSRSVSISKVRTKQISTHPTASRSCSFFRCWQSLNVSKIIVWQQQGDIIGWYKPSSVVGCYFFINRPSLYNDISIHNNRKFCGEALTFNSSLAAFVSFKNLPLCFKYVPDNVYWVTALNRRI